MTPAGLRQQLGAFARFPSHIHGPAHWFRVRRFGALLSAREGLPTDARRCVEIFSLVHDLARLDDGGGNQHAIDGASYVDEVLPAVFGALPSEQIETVRAAIRYHSDGLVAQAAGELGLFDRVAAPRESVVRTIACCWDADRLDLPRVGILPQPRLMSTASWRDILPLALRIHRRAST
ncbi:MAG: hypothetical protein JOZ69_06470 [Myxococcales bacterium]|nr:hypothetical protein [Myxococcales bacterium]